MYISVIDDDVFEEDEHFYCRLSNPRYIHPENQINNNLRAKELPNLQLSTPSIATVMILDDDHSGIFSFPSAKFEVYETVGTYNLPVTRYSGARGRVILPYKTIELTAKNERDFIATEGELIFENNQTR